MEHHGGNPLYGQMCSAVQGWEHRWDDCTWPGYLRQQNLRRVLALSCSRAEIGLSAISFKLHLHLPTILGCSGSNPFIKAHPNPKGWE